MAKRKAKKKDVKKTVKRKKIVRKTVASKKEGRKGGSMALAIVALILNVLILPGLGSLIGGKIRVGIWQIVLAIVGFILSSVLIGVPILIVAWIWGIVTGVRLVQEAN
ncbi:MAG: hypothetical protein KJ718_03140 [Nanoarchaeota archaeon]|nr:hypothetical protein [Nanoarchaeota archaeon]MBU1051524.1 hypothetical protein [Nanoarchaeota archaeon]